MRRAIPFALAFAAGLLVGALVTDPSNRARRKPPAPRVTDVRITPPGGPESPPLSVAFVLDGDTPHVYRAPGPGTWAVRLADPDGHTITLFADPVTTNR